MAFIWNSLNEFPYTKNYDDDLREMLARMRELMEKYDTLLSEFETIKAQFIEVQNNFNSLEGKFSNLENDFHDLENQFAQLQNDFDYVKSIVDNIQILYDNFVTLIDNKIAQNNIKIYDTIAEIKTGLENQIKELERMIEQIGRHDILNKLEGRVEAIGIVVQDYFESLRTHALTNAEFSELGLTNDEFAAFNITNKQFITQGKDWLNYFWRFTGINPLTGFKTRESNVNSFLWTELIGSISNNEWIALDLTNDEYAALDLTNAERCYYNRHLPNIGAGFVRYDALGSGLTNSEYRKLTITT